MARRPTERQKRLEGIHAGDRTLWRAFAPWVSGFVNLIVAAWLVLFIVAMVNKAGEGITLTAIAAVPLLLVWLFVHYVLPARDTPPVD